MIKNISKALTFLNKYDRNHTLSIIDGVPLLLEQTNVMDEAGLSDQQRVI